MHANNKTLGILIAAAGVAAIAFTLTTVKNSDAAKKPGTVTAVKPTPAPATTVTPTPVQQSDAAEDVIQIALLLDTSSSMSGLINQARTQLWKIVNEMSEARRDGRRPKVQLALYEYGKPSLGIVNGYLRQIVPLTDDLDQVSEQLFALTTNGGDEHAGQVIQAATQQLQWSEHEKALKLIFIAGNEGFEQGPVSYQSAIAEAQERGIVVNTIYCGDADDPVRQGWVSGASLAGGRSLNIDHNRAIMHIAAPQDADIARLGAKLNDTYIGYGRMGMANEARQMAQDSNAHKSGSMVARSVSKASMAYSNAHWDLLDGLRDGKVALESMDEGELPGEMRTMSTEERKEYVEGKQAERKELQAKIRELSVERDKFIAEKRKAMGEAGKDTLDAAMIEVITTLAKDKGFSVK